MASNISRPLLPCKEEAKNFRALFEIDVQIDTEEAYLLSGIAK
jgi:hypothetical protein